MGLTDKQIDSFIALYKKKFNKDISREQAIQDGEKVLSLVEGIIYAEAERNNGQESGMDTQIIEHCPDDKEKPEKHGNTRKQ
jgi:hypothetical protein